MKDSVLNELQNLYPGMKGAEKRVADSILRDPGSVIHLSITELAENSASSEATIVRFCRRLGCKGYQSFKIRVASELVSPLDDICEEVEEGDDTAVMMQKVFGSCVFSLNKTLRIADPAELEKAVGILAGCGEIAFFGMGGSAAVASDACHKFMRSGKRCEAYADSHCQAMAAALLTEKDCVVAVSNSGSSKELIENLQIAKERGARVISVTSNSRSPIAGVSDVVLVSYGKEQNFKPEAMASRISALCLLDCLFVGLCRSRRDEYARATAQIRDAIATKRY